MRQPWEQDPEAWKNLTGKMRDAKHQIEEGARQMAVAFRPAVLRARMALEAFGAVYLRVAMQAYKDEHGKLPGSERTARLRKKRRDIVLRWFNERLEQAASDTRTGGERP